MKTTVRTQMSPLSGWRRTHELAAMFNALKKFVGSNNAQQGDSPHGAKPPPGIQALDQSLQKKFSKGVHYNMKIVLKGDRNVGKTCLFLRLQGQPFKEEYIPTEEIKVCSINWSYKTTDDVVKVDVWDVVDRGKKRKPLEGLKMSESASNYSIPESADTADNSADVPALDAEFIDVYKGTNGVILMLDITKQWTFDYIERELPKIPTHIPVLILANHLDMQHHRVITEEQVRFFVESYDRGENGAPLRYAESSMRNGFGLKFLHKFFNLPFLQLQRERLLQQLERNALDIQATNEELDALQESDDQNYEKFLDSLNERRRMVAEKMSNASQLIEQQRREEAVAARANAMRPSASASNLKEKVTQVVNQALTPNAQQPSVPKPAVVNTMKVGGGVLPSNLPKSVSLPGGIVQLAQQKSAQTIKSLPQQALGGASKRVTSPSGSRSGISTVDDFIPDSTDMSQFNSFLNEQVVEEKFSPVESDDEEDDDKNGNPMVKEFQDELEDSDLVFPSSSVVSPNVSAIHDNGDDNQHQQHNDDVKQHSDGARDDDRRGDEAPNDDDDVDIGYLGKEIPAKREEPDGTSSPPDDIDNRSNTWKMTADDLEALESQALANSFSGHKLPKSSSPDADEMNESNNSTGSKTKRHSKKSRKEKEGKREKEREGRREKERDGKREGKKHKSRRSASSPVDPLEEFLGTDDSTPKAAQEEYEAL